MTYGLQQIILLLALTAALGALDPCSEVYPGLNADFVTTQTKVTHCPLCSLTPHYINAVISLIIVTIRQVGSGVRSYLYLPCQ